jgi:hypothetical protein
MIYFIPNILSIEECVFLSEKFQDERKVNVSSDLKKDTNKSFGFRPSYSFDKYMDNLKPKVLEFNPKIGTLNNINTYVREYSNGGFLKKHTDRKDISVTMSICLESTINKEWPLFAEIEGKEYSFNTNPGDGILLFGADRNIHWRDDLICEENERVIQFFLHWSPIDYIDKKTKSLI